MLTYADVCRRTCGACMCWCWPSAATSTSVPSYMLCPHTPIYVSSYSYLQPRRRPRCALLHTRPHTSVYVSSYSYICVLILLHTSSYCYRCYIRVLILPYMCPHTPIYVFSCCYVCVLMLLYMCPHAGAVLNRKLAAELQPGALVVSWYVPLHTAFIQPSYSLHRAFIQPSYSLHRALIEP